MLQDNVSVPVPTFTSDAPVPPAVPPSWIAPLTVVERLLLPMVIMVALLAVLVSENESVKPPLLTMIEFPAELALINVIAPLLVKLGANAELLTTPEPLISKSARLTAKEYAGAPAVNWIVLIDVGSGPEMVTDVAAPLFVNVAMLSGTAGLELQFVPWVHSFGFGGGAVQV